MNPVTVKVGVLAEREGKILLIREWSNKKAGHFWNIIKGTLDKPGESLLECASRECMEEAGVKIQLTGIIDLSYSPGASRLQVNFLGRPIPGSVEIELNRKEQTERGEDIVEKRWFSRVEAMGIEEDQFINSRAFCAVRLWADGVSFSLELLGEGD
jgi:8-oxo-dGTP pyrophosphatase MutT (NUDIX family)